MAGGIWTEKGLRGNRNVFKGWSQRMGIDPVDWVAGPASWKQKQVCFPGTDVDGRRAKCGPCRDGKVERLQDAERLG